MFVRTALLTLLCAWMLKSSLGRRCRKVKCPVLSCTNPLPPPKGKCCSTCALQQCYDRKTGANYDVGANVPRQNPCKQCTCVGGEKVVCQRRQCGWPSCPGEVRPVTKKGACCPSCPSQTRRCSDQGSSYNVSDNVPRSDPCTSCTCKDDGDVLCVSKSCAVVCGAGVDAVKKRGECCPTCPRICIYQGTNYIVGDNVPTSDPCKSCTCKDDGEVNCALISCAIPDCGLGVETVRKEGGCCPSCPQTCFDQESDKNYNVGDKVPRSNPCTTCRCADDGKVTCVSLSCDIPNCGAGVEVVSKEGDCCPSCPQTCFDQEADKNYNVGDKVPRSNPCTTCRCADDGVVKCFSLSCDLPYCGVGVEAVNKEGDCCPSCPRP